MADLLPRSVQLPDEAGALPRPLVPAGEAQELAAQFAGVARALAAEQSVEKTLARLVDVAVAIIPGCHHAGVTVVRRGRPGDAGGERRGAGRGGRDPVRDRPGTVPVRDRRARRLPDRGPGHGRPVAGLRPAGGRAHRRPQRPGLPAVHRGGHPRRAQPLLPRARRLRRRGGADRHDPRRARGARLRPGPGAGADLRPGAGVEQQPDDRDGDRDPDGHPPDHRGGGLRPAAGGQPAQQPPAARDRRRGGADRRAARADAQGA